MKITDSGIKAELEMLPNDLILFKDILFEVQKEQLKVVQYSAELMILVHKSDGAESEEYQAIARKVQDSTSRVKELQAIIETTLTKYPQLLKEEATPATETPKLN